VLEPGRLQGVRRVTFAGRNRRSEPEIFAQIDLAHLGVVEDVRGAALGDDMAFADDVRGLADIQSLAHVVIGDQYTNAAFLQVLMMVLISPTEMGSTPAKGSSSNMN
jgi:hypothetical protein